MQIDASRGALHVRVGWTFDARDVTRLQEALAALGPFSRLTIDFSRSRQCDDAAVARLAGVLRGFPGGAVALRGLTRHQQRLLALLGGALDDAAAPGRIASAPG